MRNINKKIIAKSVFVIVLILSLSTIAYAKPFTDAFRGGLLQINDFFAKEQYKPYSQVIDFFFFSLLFIAIYMMGVRYAFKEVKRPEQVIAILLGLMTAFLLVLGGFSATILIPYIHWLLYVLLFILYWWLLKGIKNKFWRFILALLLTLLTIALFQGLFDSLTAPDAEGFFKSLGRGFGAIQFPELPGPPGVPDYLSNLFGAPTAAPTGPDLSTLPSATTPVEEKKEGWLPGGYSAGHLFWILPLLVALSYGGFRLFRRARGERRPPTTIINEIDEMINKKTAKMNEAKQANQVKNQMIQAAENRVAIIEKLEDPSYSWEAVSSIQEGHPLKDLYNKELQLITKLKELIDLEKTEFLETKLANWQEIITREAGIDDASKQRIAQQLGELRNLVTHKTTIRDIRNMGILWLIVVCYDFEKREDTLTKELDQLLQEHNVEALIKDKFAKVKADNKKLQTYNSTENFIIKLLNQKIELQKSKLEEVKRLISGQTPPTQPPVQPTPTPTPPTPTTAPAQIRIVLGDYDGTNIPVTVQDPGNKYRVYEARLYAQAVNRRGTKGWIPIVREPLEANVQKLIPINTSGILGPGMYDIIIRVRPYDATGKIIPKEKYDAFITIEIQPPTVPATPGAPRAPAQKGVAPAPVAVKQSKFKGIRINLRPQRKALTPAHVKLKIEQPLPNSSHYIGSEIPELSVRIEDSLYELMRICNVIYYYWSLSGLGINNTPLMNRLIAIQIIKPSEETKKYSIPKIFIEQNYATLKVRLMGRIDKRNNILGDDEINIKLVKSAEEIPPEAEPVAPEPHTITPPIQGEPLIPPTPKREEPVRPPSSATFAELERIGWQILDEIYDNRGHPLANLSNLTQWLTSNYPSIKVEPITRFSVQGAFRYYDFMIRDIWGLIVLTIDGKNGVVVPALDRPIAAGITLEWFEGGRYDGTQVLWRGNVIKLAKVERKQIEFRHQEYELLWEVTEKGIIDLDSPYHPKTEHAPTESPILPNPGEQLAADVASLVGQEGLSPEEAENLSGKLSNFPGKRRR